MPALFPEHLESLVVSNDLDNFTYVNQVHFKANCLGSKGKLINTNKRLSVILTQGQAMQYIASQKNLING